ncbi:MAG: IS1634 family transposase [Candidatus Methanoperedens sp.]
MVQSKRRENKIIQEYLLKLGRLDNLNEPQRIELENKISTIGGSDILKKFHDILYSIGYSFPSPVSTFEVGDVFGYGQELALHKVCEEIDFINIVNRHGYKGGGPELGKIVEIMAIARNCDPCSYFQVSEWYSRSYLPFFLKLQQEEFTYNVAIRALDYLQPENTIPMQISLYEKIRHVYGYECERLDIDLTSTYFEGDECILAEFGHPRGHTKDKLQIVVAFVVDQKGVIVTHKVWPGNRTDVKSLKPMDRCLKNEFGLDAPRVVDRGMATWENLKYMDRKKERYLVALRAKIKSTKFLEEIKIPRDEWMNTGNNEVATSIIKGRRKYVVAWNASVAQTNKKGREARISKAEDEFRLVLESVEKGEIKSRTERDEKIGHIKKKYKVTRYLVAKGKRSGFGFTIKRTKLLDELDKYDGYQVFVTTEFDLNEKEVLESYRTRDQIEKAIRTLKSVLGLHPQNVRTKEHVLGNIFVCSTAFQLRSLLKMKINNSGLDVSIEEAMKTLERLKAVHIVVGKDEGIQVHRKLSGLNKETRTLIEVFGMANNKVLPEVDTENFK